MAPLLAPFQENVDVEICEPHEVGNPERTDAPTLAGLRHDIVCVLKALPKSISGVLIFNFAQFVMFVLSGAILYQLGFLLFLLL